MTRIQADLLLLLAAAIWGTTFVAQKDLAGIGPLTFVAARFFLSFLMVLPLAIREKRRRSPISRVGFLPVLALCVVFSAAIILQQMGISLTTVTDAGFLTGLYVVFTPLVAWAIFRRPPEKIIWFACGAALLGYWFLNGGKAHILDVGDFLLLLCAFFFAVHVVMTGYIVQKTSSPFIYVALQYGIAVLIAFAGALAFETLSLDAFIANATQILYAGIVSGGIAYTIQPVAQQHTPSSDAAVIMSSEALFAALSGAILLGERLDAMAWTGCGFILFAILLVELWPLLLRRFLS